ncbi:MAG TPA: sialate O-acetylesterase [Mucilaginibacter sp.]
MTRRWLFLAVLLMLFAACKKEPKNQNNNGGNNGGNTGDSKFTFGSALQSNMVIQRDKPFVIWGTARAKQSVTINVSWNATPTITTADDAGNWKVSIPAAVANSTPQTITGNPNGDPAVTLNNILIGDVWLCVGQSNMTMPVDAISPFLGVTDYPNEIASANYPLIRTATVQSDYEDTPQANFKTPATWVVCSPSTVGPVSAVAYFFARKLNITLNVPIGIIVSSINGSYGQEWANQEAITGDFLLNAIYGSNNSSLYNGMISPLTNLNVKGFLWYQGENNQHDNPANYTKLNQALIAGWRTKFNNSKLPFYLVQLTPFAEDYATTNPPGGDKTLDYLAKFREGQANVLTLPGTGMAVTMDVGEVDNHHPRNKKPVGERLALLALKNDYGQNVQTLGPHFSSWSTTGNTAMISFAAGTANGLTTGDGKPLNQFFFVAGGDHVFHQATATIVGSTVRVVAAPDTPLPILSVRYAFTNAPVTNLQNSAGLPAEPFRTDNWDN